MSIGLIINEFTAHTKLRTPSVKGLPFFLSKACPSPCALDPASSHLLCKVPSFCSSRSVFYLLLLALALISVDSINQVSLCSDFHLNTDKGRHHQDTERWQEAEAGVFIHNRSPLTGAGRSSVPTSVYNPLLAPKPLLWIQITVPDFPLRGNLHLW